MLAIRRAGWSAMVDELVRLDGHRLMYVSLIGVQTHADAIAATLLGQRSVSAGVMIGDDYVLLDDEYSYRRFESRFKEEHLVYKRVTLVSEICTVTSLHGPLLFIEKEGTDRPASFFPRLTRLMHAPVLPAWEDWLWAEGQEPLHLLGPDYVGKIKPHKVRLIEELDAVGLRVWRVDVTPRHWVQLIRQHFGLGYRLHDRTDYTYEWADGEWSIKYDRAKRYWFLYRNGVLQKRMDDKGDEVPILGDTAHAVVYAADESLGEHLILEGEYEAAD